MVIRLLRFTLFAVLCGFAGYGFLVAAQDVALRQMERDMRAVFDASDEAGA